MHDTGCYTADDGTELWYGCVGEGPPIVLCDGLGCDGFVWSHLIDALVDEFTLVRWHYRGHGESDIPDDLGSMTLETLADDLRGLFEALELESAVLAGHSLGVQLLFEYADLAPGTVRGLVPICGSYKYPLDTFHDDDTLKQMLPYMERLVDYAPGTTQRLWSHLATSKLSKFIATTTETDPRRIDLQTITPYLEHVARMDVRVFVELLSNAADHSAEALLPDLELPTLIVAGEDDTFTPLYRSREMAELIEDSTLVVVPGGTHVAPLEAPDLVNHAIADFARDL
jgi:pimeloyl-ACP methyl ester carboxylesterase